MAKSKKKLNPILAYENIDFLNSHEARGLRVQSEFLEPEKRLAELEVENTIIMFGSARIKDEKDAQKDLKLVSAKVKKAKRITPKLKKELERAQNMVALACYYKDAVYMAEELTKWSMTFKDPKKRYVICSGGGPGIMEAANKGAYQAKGPSMGLNIQLPFEQQPNPYQTEEHCFDFHYFFIRKFWFLYMAKAAIVFPGGYGTMDEMFEVLTLIQTGKIDKTMPIVLYGSRYWDEVMTLETMDKWGMISPEDLDLFKVMDDPDEVVAYIKKQLKKTYKL